ncbi:MAG: hypothetical protein JSW47_05320 [Phycisphaerales bacterium]|nr:MAG: hypothetical protein JSW47_05320 [Phycisphaerales bacterium]
MESHNYLGIYISTDTATAVCLGPQGKGGNLLGCFSVSIEDKEQANMLTLASLLAQGCAEKKLKFSEVSVALDCAMFMQHNVHSEFSDPKQIAATVKFDTEEALATDIAEVALAFEIASSDEAGSNLNVFTSQRTVLSEVLEALQQYNLDPIAMEPDVGCLSRFISRMVGAAESHEGETLFGMLSQRRGYLVALPVTSAERTRMAPAVRTFLVGPSQDRGKLLAREVLVTTALVKGAKPVDCLRIFDSAGEVDCREVSQKLGIEADKIDLYQAAGAEPQAVDDCASPVDFAIAHGAALSHWHKGHSVNFRDDFNPFEGKTLRMHRALRFAAVCVTILLIAGGLYFHTPLVQAHAARANLRSRFAKNYSDVTLGKLRDGVDVKKAIRELTNLKRKIERGRKGLDPSDKLVSSKLTLVLVAFNKCAKQTDLNVKSINISGDNITITGDTSSQSGQVLYKAIKDSGLQILKEGGEPKAGRLTFNYILRPKA